MSSPARHRDAAYGYDGTTWRPLKVRTDGALVPGGALVPDQYDEIDLGYTGSNLTTVTYKLAGVTVATLTLTYSGSTLTSVVKT